MRAPLVLALSVIGISVGAATATAADLSYRPAPRDAFGGPRAAPLVLYRYEPGVSMRAYWLPPWRNRHYFPHSHAAPSPVARKHHRPAWRTPAAGRPRPAETYVRFWSNAAAFPRPCAPERPRRRPFPPVPPNP